MVSPVLLTRFLSLLLGLQLGALLRRLVRKKRDPVTASGRLIAAWRALESLEPHPLFADPFAAALAGREAVKQALQLAQPFPQPSGAATAPSAPHFRRFRYSNIGARVWWFDQQLAAALSLPAARAGQPPRQVVVLGAGYDSRPWRLRLPSGVCWLEVDLPQVAAAKARLLQQLDAGLEAGKPAAHPLQAAKWAGLAGDLCQPGWSNRTAAAGLNSSQPVVWVLEGLLMYLDPQQAISLLQEMAGVSPPGSCIILHHTTTDLADLIGQGETAYAPFPPKLVATWRSNFPAADHRSELAALLAAAGWPLLREVTSRARIAAHIVASQSSSGEDGSGREGEGAPSRADPNSSE